MTYATFQSDGKYVVLTTEDGLELARTLGSIDEEGFIRFGETLDATGLNGITIVGSVPPGRDPKAMTVGELRKALRGVPDEMLIVTEYDGRMTNRVDEAAVKTHDVWWDDFEVPPREIEAFTLGELS